MQAYTLTDHIQLAGVKRHMPSTVAEGEKRHKAVIKDKNRHKNSYKSYIIQLRSTVETADRLR